MMAGRPKRPKSGEHARPERRPATAEASSPERRPVSLPGQENSDQRLCWRFQFMDRQAPWGLASIQPADWPVIIDKLRNLETMTVHEVFAQSGNPGKDYDLAALPTRAATGRLHDLDLDDQDRVSRIRLGGKLRLYGFRHGNIFHILWWDPEHQVWPSKKGA